MLNAGDAGNPGNGPLVFLTFLAMRLLAILVLSIVALGCARESEAPRASPGPRNLILITIDTLRADRVGSYGYTRARTPAFDALAARGTRFDRAFAPAPITLTSHASLMTGRYPPGHGARHNGMRTDSGVPLLAETLGRHGFDTAAFIAAFPLDRRFGLDRGFKTYSDRMPRSGGRTANERPGAEVASEAIAWLNARRAGQGGASRFFLWVHLFEPHAPYGASTDSRPVGVRYDDEVADADRQVARIVEAAGPDRDQTLFVVAADHGEAFGEHGEIAHSIFVYDTTLRVPLVMAGPGIGARVVQTPVSLVDVAPTVVRLLGLGAFDADGQDLGPALAGGGIPARALYAESFAPLLDFGWSPLRSVRDGGWKLIEAPRPELFQVAVDPAEERDLATAESGRVAALREKVGRYSADTLEPKTAADPEAAARLQSLGYVGAGRADGSKRPDPKDRLELAGRIAQITSGELHGPPLETAIRRVLESDPQNPQMHLRLGFALQDSGRCPEAIRHFSAAIEARMPGADPYLGLAACHVQARRVAAALRALNDAGRAEPGNPVVAANLGIVLSDNGRPAEAVPALQRALEVDPDFHEARFNLAVAFARLNRRTDAAREAEDLLRRLPGDAPQRSEVERLLKAVQ